MHTQLLQLCLTLCNPMDRSPSASSVHGILQARILEWVAMPSSRRSFWPRNQTRASCTADFLPTEPTGKPIIKDYNCSTVKSRVYILIYLSSICIWALGLFLDSDIKENAHMNNLIYILVLVQVSFGYIPRSKMVGHGVRKCLSPQGNDKLLEGMVPIYTPTRIKRLCWSISSRYGPINKVF